MKILHSFSFVSTIYWVNDEETIFIKTDENMPKNSTVELVRTLELVRQNLFITKDTMIVPLQKKDLDIPSNRYYIQKGYFMIYL